MSLNSGERQVAPTIEGIRADHVARYEWAAAALKPGSYVIDVGCGIGYGAYILAEAGHRVYALDVDRESIAYAREHYAHRNISFTACDVTGLDLPPADAAVCFEMIEHVADPLPMLRALRERVGTLLASVPNEEVMPFRGPGHENGYTFHFRHYTRDQFNRLLIEEGFQAMQWLGQVGPNDPVQVGVNGRTLVALAIADEGIGGPLPRGERTIRAPAAGEAPVLAHVSLELTLEQIARAAELAREWGDACAAVRRVEDELCGLGIRVLPDAAPSN